MSLQKRFTHRNNLQTKDKDISEMKLNFDEKIIIPVEDSEVKIELFL